SRTKVHVIFFFFQAEDGIRDFHVTGVQTCALPISQTPPPPKPQPPSTKQGKRQKGTQTTTPEHRVDIELRRSQRRGNARQHSERSEEGRVGKEGRTRYSLLH